MGGMTTNRGKSYFLPVSPRGRGMPRAVLKLKPWSKIVSPLGLHPDDFFSFGLFTKSHFYGLDKNNLTPEHSMAINRLKVHIHVRF